MYIALTLLAIGMLVVLHELGHFGVARACNMRVLRFSVGFGPIIYQRQIGEVIWQLAAVPLGGFVLIDGMSGEDAPLQPDARLFSQKPMWQRVLVIFAGPLANFVTCAALLAGLAATSGMASVSQMGARLGPLRADAAAWEGGLRPGDLIVSIEGAPIANWEALVLTVRAHPGEPLEFVVRRDGQLQRHQVTAKVGADSAGVIGAVQQVEYTRYSLAQSLPRGIVGAWDLTAAQARLLWGMVRGHSSGKLTGLPGIVKMVSQQAEKRLSHLFEQMAYLSVGLGLLNLLPIPALDGSRLLFLLVEMIRRRPLDERLEGILHTAGFVLLLGVMLFVSVRDML